MLNHLDIKIKLYTITGIIELGPEDIVDNSVNFNNYVATGEFLTYGSVTSGEFSFTTNITSANWKNVDYVEYISTGKLLFTGFIESYKKDDDVSEITCLDPLSLLDTLYVEGTDEVFFTDKNVVKIIKAVLNRLITKSRIPDLKIIDAYNISSVPTLATINKEDLKKATWGDIVGWCLEIIGAVLTCNGKSILIRTPKISDVEIGKKYLYDPLIVRENALSFTGVVFTKEEKGEDDKKEYKDLLAGSNTRAYEIKSNPFILDNAEQSWVDNLYNRDKSLVWTPLRADVDFSRADEIQLLNVITLTDRQGRTYKALITEKTFTHGGKVSIESVGLDWKLEKSAAGGKSFKNVANEQRLLRNNIDVVFNNMNVIQDEFNNNFEKERRERVDDILKVTGTLRENKIALSKDLYELKLNLNSNNEKLIDFNNRLNDNKEKTDNIDITLNSFRTSIDNEITEINESIDTNLGRIISLETDLESGNTYKKINAIQTTADTNKSTIATLSNNLSNLNTWKQTTDSTINTISSKVGDNLKKITNMTVSIDGISSTVATMSGKVEKSYTVNKQLPDGFSWEVNGTKVVFNEKTFYIPNATIKSAMIKSLNGNKITANSIGASRLMAGAVGTDQLYSNAVTADKLLVDSALINKLMTDTILSDKIWANITSTDKLTSNFIRSTLAEIGGFKIGSAILAAGSGESFVRLSGAENHSFILAGGSSWDTAKFAVSEKGTVKATNAEIMGTIWAESGQIGHWRIDSEGIWRSGNGYFLHLKPSTPYPIFFGKDSKKGEFMVSQTGTVTARNIKAEGGTVGGFTITGDTLTGPNGLRLAGGKGWTALQSANTSISSTGKFTGSSGSYGGSHSGSGSFSSGSMTGNIYSSSGRLGKSNFSSGSSDLYISGLMSAGKGLVIGADPIYGDSPSGSIHALEARLIGKGWTFSNSDIRLKENISELTHEYDKYIYELPLIKYTYKSDEKHTPQVGVNANYLMKILPEYMAKSFLHQNDVTGLYGANYESLVPFMIKTIQDLNNRVIELEKAR